MKFEGFNYPLEKDEAESSLDTLPDFSVSLYELREKAVQNSEIRDDLLQMCDSLFLLNRRYTAMVLKMNSGQGHETLDEPRRRAHDAIINTLQPLARAVKMEQWFQRTFTDDSRVNRELVGKWAIRQALESLLGEIYRYESEHETRGGEAA